MTGCNRPIDIKNLDLEEGTPIVVHDSSWGMYYQFGIYINRNSIIIQRYNNGIFRIESYTLDLFSNYGKYEIFEYLPWYNYDKDLTLKRALSIPIGKVIKGEVSPLGDDFVCWCLTGDPLAELRCYSNIGHHYIQNKRKILKYQHHAVAIESGLIVHFADNEAQKLDIVLGRLSDLKEPHIKLHSNLAFTDYFKSRNRALMYLCGFYSIDKYNLASNNCEHFATWCAIGKRESKQVKTAIWDATILTITLLTKKPNPIVIKSLKKYLF